MKVRLKYTKDQSVKYISHLDLLRMINRALKRAKIDISYTQGFNPHPKVFFALPLSVGITSEAEYMDIELNTFISCEKLIADLNKALPNGIRMVKAKNIIEKEKKKSISAKISLADYRIDLTIKKKLNNEIEDIINKLISQDELKVEKYSKKGMQYINIIPHIHIFKIKEIKDNKISLYLRLNAGSVNNLNPLLCVQALEKNIQDFKIDDIKIHRIELLSENGVSIF